MVKGVELIMRPGVPGYIGYKFWFSKLISALAQKHPELRIHVIARSTKETLVELMESEVNIALTTASVDDIKNNENYDHIQLFEDELVAILPANSPCANQAFLLEDDFNDLPYITNNAVPQKNREYELYFVPEKIMPRHIIQAGPNEAIVELVNNSLGMTIMSRRVSNSYVDKSNIAVLPLGKKSSFFDWHIVYGKDEKLLAPALLLAEILIKDFADLSIESPAG